MSITARLNYLRIAPRKVRLAADAIREKSVKEAQTILSFAVKKSTEPLLKLLNQAVNSARNNFQLEADNLYISKITVDEGPKLKRWRPRARGQAYEIQKKTSHITIILDEIVKKPKKIKKTPPKAIKEKMEKIVQKVKKEERPKLRPEAEAARPKIEKGIKRIFRRKAF